ncbi:MAG: nitrilase-related carbon-nitrogen hydrolase [Holophagae bacterium]|jgi:predicted amidohydrolase
MKAYLSRWVSLDTVSNLERFEAESGQAAADGADLVVFPELFLTGYSRRIEPAHAREVFARISAAAPEVLFVFGSMSEDGRNRVTAWRAGRELARYDKVHLFHPNREHEFWRPGSSYVAFGWRGLRVGLMNCNDVRFPEQARALKLDARCDMLVVPAWWPWRRDHIWSTLLQARAAENQLWVLGCCIAGSAFDGEEFAGAGNHVFDPSGEPVRTADDRTYEIQIENPPDPIVDPVEHFVAIEDVVVVEE